MRILIVDANNISHIVWHAFGNVELSYEDELTGILWGFFNQIGKLSEQFETNRFVFCWDSRQRKRQAIYPGYKGNRGETHGPIDDDTKAVFAQFKKLRVELLPQFGFKNVLWSVGYEADDLIATTVRHLGTDAMIVSTDKDMWQLLGIAPIYRPVTKEIMTLKKFRTWWSGIEPEQNWVKMRAMIGDVSDNIPGIKGIGEKTAYRYLMGQVKPGTKAYRDIVSPDGQEILARNEQLMKLPFPGTPDFDLDFNETFRTDDFLAICDRYGFQSFLKPEPFDRWRARFNMVN